MSDEREQAEQERVERQLASPMFTDAERAVVRLLAHADHKQAAALAIALATAFGIDTAARLQDEIPGMEGLVERFEEVRGTSVEVLFCCLAKVLIAHGMPDGDAARALARVTHPLREEFADEARSKRPDA